MSWTPAIIIGIVLVAILAKRLSLVSQNVARRRLAEGALIIDVRSQEEFQHDHLSNAINIPLGDLREALPRRVKDKNQPLLVHCLSGGRSALAKQQLKGMGYTSVFNLGSLTRAKRIIAES